MAKRRLVLMMMSPMMFRGRLPLLWWLLMALPTLVLIWLLGIMLTRRLSPLHRIRRCRWQRSSMMVRGRRNFVRPRGRKRVRSEPAVAITPEMKLLEFFLRRCQVTIAPSLIVWPSGLLLDVRLRLRPGPHQIHATM